MEISVYNSSFNKIAIVDSYTSLMCCKRYYDVGALDLQLEATTETLNIFKKNYFITRKGDNTIYRIEAIKINTAENHDNHLIIGAVDCKTVLSQRVIAPIITFNGTVENYIHQLINDNLINPRNPSRKISNFVLTGVKGFADTISQETDYEVLSEKIIDLCKTYNLGWQVLFEDGIFYIDFYRGTNRSKNQSVNNPVVFSPEQDNLINSEYNYNSTKYKNVAIVYGENSSGTPLSVEIGDGGTGFHRHEKYVEYSTAFDGEDITAYQNLLRSKGKEELAKTLTVTSFEGEVYAESYIYDQDYSLGDVVTIENEYGISVDARIVEVIETWDDNGYSLEPKFEYMEVTENVNENIEGAVLTETNVMLLSETGEALTVESTVSGNGVKMSALTEAQGINDSDYLPILQNGITKKITYETFNSNLQNQIDDKVDKINGKGLSANDFTTAEKNKLASLNNYDDTSLQTQITELESSIETTVTNAVAEIVANAPEDFDTLKEMSDWIAEHEDDAAAMNSTIQENKTALANKVDKVTGMGLSTNDYTTAEKNKLAGLNNYDDSSIVENLNNKVDKVDGKQLSTNDFTDEDKTKLDSLNNYDDSSLVEQINNKVDKVSGKGLSSNDYTTAEKNKLAGLSNYDDTDLQEQINNKVDKVSGKGLSANDFTNAYKTKLDGLSNYNDSDLVEQVEEIENNTRYAKTCSIEKVDGTTATKYYLIAKTLSQSSSSNIESIHLIGSDYNNNLFEGVIRTRGQNYIFNYGSTDLPIELYSQTDGTINVYWKDSNSYNRIVFDIKGTRLITLYGGNLSSVTPTGTLMESTVYDRKIQNKLGKPTSSYVETTAATSSFSINIDSSKDVLQVFVNGFKLIQDLDYTFTNRTITLTKAVDAGSKVEIVVYKGE